MVEHGTSLRAVNDNRVGAGLAVEYFYALCCVGSPLVFEISLSLPFLHYFSNHFSCQTRKRGKPLPVVPWQLFPGRGGKTAFQTGANVTSLGLNSCPLLTLAYAQRLKNLPGLLPGSIMAISHSGDHIWTWVFYPSRCIWEPQGYRLFGVGLSPPAEAAIHLTAFQIPNCYQILWVHLSALVFGVTLGSLKYCSRTEHIRQGIQGEDGVDLGIRKNWHEETKQELL